jgi:FMN phosphatase YigB (HAD superfamily)
VTLRAVFFDVGETLVDEERYWREVSRIAGVQPHVVWAALGKTIERGEEHWELWAHLGMERPATAGVVYSAIDLYPEARRALAEVRASGVFVGVAGNQSSAMEEWARSAELPVDLVTSSASLGVRKPDPAFFERLAGLADARAAEIAYVGDRADNDVVPALAAGLVAFHVRRGPWGRLQETPEGAVAIDSLLEVPSYLGATSAVGA